MSDSCLSGELAQSVMILSMLTLEKPGSCAITALEAPPLAPVADDPDVSAEPLVLPAAEVEPVVSVVEEPEEPEPLEPASAVEPDAAPEESVVPEEPDAPELLEPASAAVEPEVSEVPVVPEEPVLAADCEPEAALKPLR
jgi:hypothetical protein